MATIPGEKMGNPSRYTCPECHGTLWELEDGDLVRYRCRVGHGFSPETMVEAQSDSVERTQWAALRALEEKADLHRRMARRARRGQLTKQTARFEDSSRDAEKQAALLRRMLLSGKN